jgi:hypothetical protein
VHQMLLILIDQTPIGFLFVENWYAFYQAVNNYNS